MSVILDRWNGLETLGFHGFFALVLWILTSIRRTALPGSLDCARHPGRERAVNHRTTLLSAAGPAQTRNWCISAMRARRRVLSALRCRGPNNLSFALCEAENRSLKHAYKGSFSHTLHDCKKSVRIRSCLRRRLLVSTRN